MSLHPAYFLPGVAGADPIALRVAFNVSPSCFCSMPKSQPRLINRQPAATRALTSSGVASIAPTT